MQRAQNVPNYTCFLRESYRRTNSDSAGSDGLTSAAKLQLQVAGAATATADGDDSFQEMKQLALEFC